MDYSKLRMVYANIPEKLRQEVVVFIDGNPYSWNAVYLEISNDTELGRRIFAKLVEMEIV